MVPIDVAMLNFKKTFLDPNFLSQEIDQVTNKVTLLTCKNKRLESELDELVKEKTDLIKIINEQRSKIQVFQDIDEQLNDITERKFKLLVHLNGLSRFKEKIKVNLINTEQTCREPIIYYKSDVVDTKYVTISATIHFLMETSKQQQSDATVTAQYNQYHVDNLLNSITYQYSTMQYPLLKERAKWNPKIPTIYSALLTSKNYPFLFFYHGTQLMTTNAKDSILFLEISAILGATKAFLFLSTLYNQLAKSNPEYIPIIKYYLSCYRNESNGFYEIGNSYFRGPLEQNYRKAIYYYDKAARKGHGKAMQKLAWIYGYGFGNLKNLTMASFWCTRLKSK